MGGSMGNPIDEAAQARINERIEEVVKTFGMEFTKAYTQAVIAKAKEDLSPSTSIEDDLKLQEAPAQSVPLKSGMLTKRGESVKNWKPRFFTIFNEKDNYKVEYRDGTNESGKLKGTIWCAGYRVEEFNSDEIADLGEPGLKLVPWSYRRRTWYMKCADDNERKEWKAAFEVACYKSKPPHDEDECIAEAFNVALRNTRWRFCYWGWYWECGAEPERLGEFLLDVLDRDILDEIIGGIAEGPAKAMTVDLIRKTIGGSVKAACGTAWASSAAAVRSVSEKIQSTVKDLVKPLIEKQNNLKEMIVEKIGGIINPFLENKAGSLFAPILGKIFEPIIKCFCTAAKEFHAFIAAKVNGGDFGKDKFDSVIDRCDWQVDWWSGPIHHAYYIIYNMYTSDLAQLASLFTGGITPYTVYNMVMDKLKTLLHRAVFTFGSLGKSVSAAELLSVLSHVTGLLFHDCCIMIQSTIIEVLKAILSPNLVEAVVTPAKTLIAPLQETIDAIPIPGLSALLDLNQLLDDTVDDITVNALTALTKKSIDKIKSNLDASRVEMGIAQVSLN